MMMVLLRTGYVPDLVSAFGRNLAADLEASTVLNQ
jgi:hypothetical protein